MLRLEVYVVVDRVADVCGLLDRLPGVRHVTTGAITSEGLVVIGAEVETFAADGVLNRLADAGVMDEDITLWRVPGIHPMRRGSPARLSDEADVWTEIVGRAHEHAELAALFLAYMVAAGVIAGVGVLTGSAVLLVGAMAISPDILPVSASAIGIVERRWGLAARAVRVLLVGLGAGALGAFVATALLRLFGRVPDDLVLADTMMGAALTELGPGSLMVAATAGVAGMLAYERPGGAAVGVAISVTTIPAASYVGAAMAMGRDDPMIGALKVLMANIVMLLIASSLTLLWQRYWRSRRTRLPA
jgi:uncharacterized hydrophobic protein (TIGR00271 family)